MNPIDKIWINCREATLLEEMRAEGKLAFSGRFALWLHLLYCRFCRLFVKQSALLKKYAADLAKCESKFRLTPQRKEAMKRALK